MKKGISNGVERQTHTIDATGKSLGRLATEVAVLLRGKDRPDFTSYKDGGGTVRVSNAGKMKITGSKLAEKKYYRHSGYMGGLKEQRLQEIFEKDPGEVLRRAVWGMLPKNKLRREQIKRLNVEA